MAGPAPGGVHRHRPACAYRFDPYDGAPPPDVEREWDYRLEYPEYREAARYPKEPRRRSREKTPRELSANRWSIFSKLLMMFVCVGGLTIPGFYNMRLEIPSGDRVEVSSGALRFTSTGPISFLLRIDDARGPVPLSCGPPKRWRNPCVSKREWAALNGRRATVEWFRQHSGPGIWRNRILSVTVEGTAVVPREKVVRWLERKRDEGEAMFRFSWILMGALIGLDMWWWRRWRG